MTPELELSPALLCRRCDPSAVPFATTTEAADGLAHLGQDRAVEAARFAIGMRRDGYNMFALGPPGLGKHTILRALLAAEAAGRPTPPDTCLVYNFAQPHRPRALRLPPGTAGRLRAELSRTVAELRVALPAAFDSDDYRSRRSALIEAWKRHQEEAFEQLGRRARDRRVAILRTESGVVVAPLGDQGVVDPDAFAKLPEPEQAAAKAKMEEVGAEVSALFQEIHDGAHQHHAALTALDREVAAAAVGRVLDKLRGAYREHADILAHLADLERDVIDNAERFAKDEPGAPPALLRALRRGEDDDARFRRYEVNVMVEHAAGGGAPVIYEDHPSYANLVGRIEHTQELGALVTDFTLIRPGALHRANGGYLLVDADKLLQQPLAWEALKRALRGREIKIEPLGDRKSVV